MNWKNIRLAGVIILLMSLVGAVILGTVFPHQTASFVFAKQAGWENPALYTLPTELSGLHCSDPAGTELSHFGVHFRIPWESIKEDELHEMSARIEIDSSLILAFFNPSETVDRREVMLSQGPEAVQEVFGSKTMASNYNLLAAILHATPDKIRIFGSKEEAIGQSILLVFKSTELLKKWSAIYTFTSGGLRGFQIGNPKEKDSIRIYAFDEDDQEYEFLFLSAKDSTWALTQTDVSCFLAGLSDLKRDSDK